VNSHFQHKHGLRESIPGLLFPGLPGIPDIFHSRIPGNEHDAIPGNGNSQGTYNKHCADVLLGKWWWRVATVEVTEAE